MGIASNLPYLLFLILCILSANMFQADHTRNKGIYWKLNSVGDKVISIDKPGSAYINISKENGTHAASPQPMQDRIFEALLSTNVKNGIWTKHETLSYCNDKDGDECDEAFDHPNKLASAR